MPVKDVKINTRKSRGLEMGRKKKRTGRKGDSSSIKTGIRAHLDHKQHFTEGPAAFAQNLIW